MINNVPPTGETPPEVLFRYQVVSQVLVREHSGESRSKAVDAVAALKHITICGKFRTVSRRSIYRWLASYENQGSDGLFPAKRLPRGSSVLPESLLDFCKQQKDEDPNASVPELIRRAKALNIIPANKKISRVSLWRNLGLAGIDTARRKSPKNRDQRRFAYPHRMQMVLCDGKHFRAGAGRLRRVALFFIDDATRMVLHAVVGTSENSRLFLRGLYGIIKGYGLMNALYTDNGSGFVAGDCIAVLRNLDVLFIQGEPNHPEGHGKIERFNQTIKQQVLRTLDGNPEIDASCSALELRLQHYLTRQYNHTPHEGINRKTPWDRFHNDEKPLRFAENLQHIRQAFVLHITRRVSGDNIVSLDGIHYEVVRGYAGAKITLYRNVLDGSVSILHLARMLRLDPVDLHANAREKRTKPEDEQEDSMGPITTCAQLNFNKEYQPIIDAAGNFATPDHHEQEVEDE